MNTDVCGQKQKRRKVEKAGRREGGWLGDRERDRGGDMEEVSMGGEGNGGEGR